MNQSAVNTPEAQLKQGISLGAKGDLDKAADLMMAAAVGQGFDFLIRVAGALEDIKRYGKAQEIYGRAMQLKPDNFLTYAKLGALFAELENFPMAVKSLEKANELNPGVGDLYFNLGLVYQSAGAIDKAIGVLELALANGATPHLVYGTLARVYEQANQIEKLEQVVKAGLKACPHDLFLNLNAAIMERRQNNNKAALKRLKGALSPKTLKKYGADAQDLEDIRVVGGFELARNYDKLGEYDKAYQHFSKANKFAGEATLIGTPSKDQALANITKLRKLNYTNWQEKTADRLNNHALTPVFLIGFPRSGTTLLHQILDAHSGLEVLEEQPVLVALTDYIEKKYNGFPEGLQALEKNELNELRDGYLRGIGNLQTKPGAVRIIDKLPMNIIKVPLITKLFPDAKFILALRHPFDCTLSCFMQNFKLNHSMMNFLNLQDATHYYHQTFSLWFKYCQEMEIDVQTVRYEDVITNLEKEARGVISYLGLEWQDQVLDYRNQAKEKKRINTPSYHQVVKPIYQDAKGRWRHYQKHLEPFMDCLSPYVEKFGYKEQD